MHWIRLDDKKSVWQIQSRNGWWRAYVSRTQLLRKVIHGRHSSQMTWRSFYVNNIFCIIISDYYRQTHNYTFMLRLKSRSHWKAQDVFHIKNGHKIHFYSRTRPSHLFCKNSIKIRLSLSFINYTVEKLCTARTDWIMKCNGIF